MDDARRTGSAFAEIDGAPLYYDVAGAGPALVLIHAGIADSRMWDEQMAAFAHDYTVIRYDVRGMGRSAMPPGPFAHHEDLRALLQILGVERAALLGASFGGAIAIDVTLAYPQLVTALATVGARPSGARPSEALRQAWAEVDAACDRGDVATAVELELRLWVDGPGRRPQQVDPAVRERVRVMNANNFAVGSDAGEERPLDPPALARLAEIHVPTLIVVGDGDVPDILEGADLLAAGIAGARQAVIHGVAHLPSMERPEEFNRLVLDFLNSVHWS